VAGPSHRPGWFDRFADVASRLVSRPWFFACCVLMVLAWAPSLPLFGSVDTWQLVINTGTTIVTFLLVALLQNAQHRAGQAQQKKLDAIAAGLAALMRASGDEGLDHAVAELRNAVGLEAREQV
jgi:low affinity Fe/Cu permease